MADVPTKTDRLEMLRQVARQRAHKLLPRVFTYLGKLLDDEDAPHGARLQAGNMILDRALGKAKETKEITANINVNEQHLDALKAINKAFLEQAEETPKMLDITPLPVSETGEDTKDNKDLPSSGRPDQASKAQEVAETKDPPSSSGGGGL